MRTVAIFTVWSDTKCILDRALENILPVVDWVIVVYSKQSNYNQMTRFNPTPMNGVEYVRFEPVYGLPVHENETRKRNFGIEQAKKEGFTHFILCDGDEFYKQEELLMDRHRVESENLNGLVHRIEVLFGRPTLKVKDHTLVPGIHKLNSDTEVGKFPFYPYAKDAKGHWHIDPTRRVNYVSGVQMSETVMYHASWIRDDIDLKIMNSAAKNNLLLSTIKEDLANAAPGYYCKFYRATIQECENIFNIEI